MTPREQMLHTLATFKTSKEDDPAYGEYYAEPEAIARAARWINNLPEWIFEPEFLRASYGSVVIGFRFGKYAVAAAIMATCIHYDVETTSYEDGMPEMVWRTLQWMRDAGANADDPMSDPHRVRTAGEQLSKMLSEKQADLERNCPSCHSPDPKLHPAMQHEGKVQPCRDEWHNKE